MVTDKKYKSGFVSIIGKTNSGKSTLVNQLVKHKVSITSRKPQTTRHRLLGIKTTKTYQAVLVDTPGFHIGQKRMLNKHMNKLALSSISGVDILLLIIEALKWQKEDQLLLERLPENQENVILVINKIDKIRDKENLLPFIGKISKKYRFLEIIPISALKGKNIIDLEKALFAYLPEGKLIYPKDRVTEHSERFLVSEIIREKCIEQVGDELPYRLTVLIDDFKSMDGIVHVHSTLFVEKNSQKGIVIGKEGKKLKVIGTKARKEIEKILGMKVMLKMWVKVKKDWSDNEALMNLMGYRVE